MKNLITLAAIAVIIGLVAWLGGCLPDSGSRSSADTKATTTAEIEPPEPLTIKIGGSSFYPAELILKTGTNVIYVNFDIAPHQIGFIGGAMGDSSIMAYNERFTYIFDQPGTYDYFCKIHPGMTGRLVVE